MLIFIKKKSIIKFSGLIFKFVYSLQIFTSIIFISLNLFILIVVVIVLKIINDLIKIAKNEYL